MSYQLVGASCGLPVLSSVSNGGLKTMDDLVNVILMLVDGSAVVEEITSLKPDIMIYNTCA